MILQARIIDKCGSGRAEGQGSWAKGEVNKCGKDLGRGGCEELWNRASKEAK
jgi:hypothetical protein